MPSLPEGIEIPRRLEDAVFECSPEPETESNGRVGVAVAHGGDPG